jgi:hypothetical protein
VRQLLKRYPSAPRYQTMPTEHATNVLSICNPEHDRKHGGIAQRWTATEQSRCRLLWASLESLRMWRWSCAQTSKLQQENTMLRARVAELENTNRTLAKELYAWRVRCEQLSRGQQQQQLPPSHGAGMQHGSLYAMPTPERRVRASSLWWMHCQECGILQSCSPSQSAV